MSNDGLANRLRSDLRDWLDILDGAEVGRHQYIDGRIQALSDVIEMLTGQQEVLFGSCPHQKCRHMGYISPLSLQCPACGRRITAAEWSK